MKKIEASGRTLEEALQEAGKALGVEADAVEYEVIEEGSKGILGFGHVPWIINAWTSIEERVAVGPAPAQDIEMIEEAEEEATAAYEAEAPIASGDDKVFVDTVVSTLTDILKAMDIDARPVVKSTSTEEIEVELVGNDLAILIGKHGQTLDALQYIIAIAANKVSGDRRRVVLDAERYRERHNDVLIRKAMEYAEAVKERGKEAVLEPQSPRDRRIIHMALADSPDVYTYSEGEGDERHVVISPKK